VERIDKTQSRNVMVQSNLGPENKHGGRIGKSDSLILRIRISGNDGDQGSGQFSYSTRVSGDARVQPNKGRDSFRVVTRKERLEL